MARAARSWLLKQADLPSRRSVLDLGCGFGIVTQELAAQAKGRVVALDHNYAALRTAPAALRASGPACGDSTALPFADASFDLVFSQLALLWMPLESTLAEIRRVMQVGGACWRLSRLRWVDRIPAGDRNQGPVDGRMQRAGADPLIGRKLPGALAHLGFEVQVELFNEMTPPVGARFDLFAGCPSPATNRNYSTGPSSRPPGCPALATGGASAVHVDHGGGGERARFR